MKTCTTRDYAQAILDRINGATGEVDDLLLLLGKQRSDYILDAEEIRHALFERQALAELRTIRELLGKLVAGKL